MCVKYFLVVLSCICKKKKESFTGAGGDPVSDRSGSGTSCKDSKKQSFASLAHGSKIAPSAGADLGLRKAVGRACREVLGDAFFTSDSPLLSGNGGASAAAAPASIDVADVESGGNALGGVDKMEVDKESLPAVGSGAGVERGTEESVPSDTLEGRRVQAVLCSLLHFALVAAGSNASPAPAVSPSSGSAPSRVTSSNSSTTSSAATTKKASLRLPSTAAATAPTLLVMRQWRFEDGEDIDEEEMTVGERITRGRNGEESDSGVKASAVAAARVGIHSVTGSGLASGSSNAATAAAAGLSSPEMLQAITALLLGDAAGATTEGTPPARASSRRSGSTKDKDGAVANDVNSQSRKVASRFQRGGGSEGGDVSKKRIRVSGGGTSGGVSDPAQTTSAPAAASGWVPDYSSRPAAAQGKTVFRTTAEGLTKLNSILRKPSLAILSSSLQLAMVRCVFRVCIYF